MNSSRRNQAEQWWPLVARGLGALIGLAEMAAGFVGYPVNAAVLTFAGGLLIAPRIAGLQVKRNEKRDLD